MAPGLRLRVGERINLKHAYKQWGKSAELLVVLLTLATFVEDALRAAWDFSSHVDTIEQVGYIHDFCLMLPRAARRLLAIALLDFGIIAQAGGVTLVLGGMLLAWRQQAAAASALNPSWPVREGLESRAAARLAPLGAKLLAVWCALHPLVYGQLFNIEFVAESCSVLGGLFILHALLQLRAASLSASHREEDEDKDEDSGDGEEEEEEAADGSDFVVVEGGQELLQRKRGHGTAEALMLLLAQRAADRQQLVGRLLLPSLWSYHAVSQAIENLMDLEHQHGHSALMYFCDGLAGFAISIAVGSIIIGLRSRLCSLSLALLNFCFAAWEHPFRGEAVPYVEGMDANSVSKEELADIHRYLFFQGLSTTGALLLLAMHGPGELAAGGEEQLLPVAVQKD